MSVRRYFGNWGGILHFVGNITLASKSWMQTFFEQGTVNLSDFLSSGAAPLAGICFITGSLILTFRGHNPKGYAAGNILALIGYSLLLCDALTLHNPASTFIGIFIGLAAALYAAVQALRLQKIINKTHALEKMDVFTLRQHLTHHITILTRKFPFWPSGVTELIADIALFVGAAQTGDQIMMFVAAMWGIGSIFLALALPKENFKIKI